jgi:hypothetical protein
MKRRSTSLRACECATSSHENAWCAEGVACQQRGHLFAGQYEDWRERRSWLGELVQRLRLLDPDYAGNDNTVLRFAHLELD